MIDRPWTRLPRRQKYRNGRVCIVCGQTFIWVRPTARFCSSRCKSWFNEQRRRVRHAGGGNQPYTPGDVMKHRLRPSVVCATPSCVSRATHGERCRRHTYRSRPRCHWEGCTTARYGPEYCAKHEVEQWREEARRAGQDYCPECGMVKPIAEKRCGPCNAEADGMVRALARRSP